MTWKNPKTEHRCNANHSHNLTAMKFHWQLFELSNAQTGRQTNEVKQTYDDTKC